MSPLTPVLPRPPHYQRGGHNRCSPRIAEAARALVEGTKLPIREIAVRVGASRATVTKLRAKHGWSRPRPPRVSNLGKRGGAAPIVPEVVAQVRALVEGTPLSYSAISERTGVSRTAICRWRKQGKWQRPSDGDGPADGRVRPTRYRRGRGRPYGADAVGLARDLVTGTLLSQAAITRQVGISQERVSAWMRRRGWVRPDPGPAGRARSGGPNAGRSGSVGSKRFAAARRVGPLATDGDRRGRPYAPSVRNEARALWEVTRLSTRIIGARVGAHPGTVSRWAKEDRWERPHGRAGARQLRGFFGSQRVRGG